MTNIGMPVPSKKILSRAITTPMHTPLSTRPA
jgi:hypothetical protein